MTVQTTVRNADLTDLRKLLVEQHARKVDIVAPATKFKAEDGDIVVSGLDPILEDDGVTDANGAYRPTAIFDEGVADKLKIPLSYIRRLREERPDLYDANVNGWLHGRKPLVRQMRATDSEGHGNGLTQPVVIRDAIPADQRSFLLRTFRGDGGEPGIARALLSDRYAVTDHLDVLMAALDGVRQAGAPVEIQGADLTDRRMYVRIVAPSIQALAPVLLERYRSPFTGATGADNPVVFAGFELSNSETGDGAFSITPRIVVEVCSNGYKITKDALRAVHLGGRMDESVIRWSEDTQQRNIQLVTAKARDAVRTFLDVGYMQRVIRELEEKAGKPFENPQDNLKVLGKKLQYDEATQDAIFAMFVKGGDLTAGGVMHAVTAAARDMVDADKAAELESSAVRALEFAYSM